MVVSYSKALSTTIHPKKPALTTIKQCIFY